MGDRHYVLGIDSSTQSTTAVLVDRETFETVAEAKIRYRDDRRLAHYGLGGAEPILPPLEEGEAAQPAALFLEAIDAVLSDLPPDLLRNLAAVNVSAQQHGQIWVSAAGCEAITALSRSGAGAQTASEGSAEFRSPLAALLGPGLALARAPIWMCSNTRREADLIRDAVGGTVPMTSRSGSDSPLRFSGAVLARAAILDQGAYLRAARIHLISSFLAAVLAGNPDAPIDWGNGSGMSLMDWKARVWDAGLLEAVAAAGALPGGAAGLATRLPGLAHPLAITGTVAAYFRERYGIPEGCVVVASSGDNPQSKVLAEGTLLSLGTSFVIMGEGTEPEASANAMYDGLGRPFLFGCRTNGSLAWERIRAAFGAADDFAAAERALAQAAPGSALRIVQPLEESFPKSPAMDIGATGSFGTDYPGAVDAALGLVCLASERFAGAAVPIAATGGAAQSRGVLVRAASLWNRRVVPIANTGAATGAAVAAACALVPEADREALAARARAVCARPEVPIDPDPAAVRAYRSAGGYLDRLAELFRAAGGIALPGRR